MTAQEFIKQYGWEKAKECLEFGKNYTDSDISFRHYNLKQLVDAWKFVEERGGLSEAKAYLKTRHIFEMDALDGRLLRSIELVESVNE